MKGVNRSRRLRDLKSLLSIIKCIQNDDLTFLFRNMNKYSRDLFSETISNLLYNTGNLKLSKSKLLRLKKKVSPHKNELEYIAKLQGSEVKKMKAINQIGGGLITAIAGILIPTIISLLSK